MTGISKAIAKTLAGGIVFAALCAPASALEIGSRSNGLGVSVDTSNSNGLGVDVGATVGGSGGVNTDVNADIGGTKGLADAKATATVGGNGGLTANVNANVAGTQGLAGVNGKVGLAGNTLADIGINVGGPTIGGPGGPGTPGGPGGPGINPGVIGGMSSAQIAAYVKRCNMVLSNPGAFESDLRELCKLLRTASR